MKMRIGNGFDVHKLKAGKGIILCGVEIPFNKQLVGHSDADVAMQWRAQCHCPGYSIGLPCAVTSAGRLALGVCKPLRPPRDSMRGLQMSS